MRRIINLWSEPKPHVVSVAAWNIDVLNLFMKWDEPVDLGDILFIFVLSKSRNSKFSHSGVCPPTTSDVFLMQPAGVHGSRPCDHVVPCPRFCELSPSDARLRPQCNHIRLFVHLQPLAFWRVKAVNFQSRLWDETCRAACVSFQQKPQELVITSLSPQTLNSELHLCKEAWITKLSYMCRGIM